MKVRAIFGDDDLGGSRCPVNVSRFSKCLSNSSVRRRLRLLVKWRVSENDGPAGHLCTSSFEVMPFFGGYLAGWSGWISLIFKRVLESMNNFAGEADYWQLTSVKKSVCWSFHDVHYQEYSWCRNILFPSPIISRVALFVSQGDGCSFNGFTPENSRLEWK